MKVDEIKELMRAMTETGMTALEYESSDGRLCLKRETAVSVSATAEGAADGSSLAEKAPVAAESGAEVTGRVVVSPLVGTVYLAPAEGEAPFVQEGDGVKKGQVLAIVEAMKLMNEIESEYAGEVVRVLVENGQTVEYGQPLFEIR